MPPANVAGCGPDYVFWLLVNGCYDPATGYAYDPANARWVYVGDNYTAGADADDAEPGAD